MGYHEGVVSWILGMMNSPRMALGNRVGDDNKKYRELWSQGGGCIP